METQKLLSFKGKITVIAANPSFFDPISYYISVENLDYPEEALHYRHVFLGSKIFNKIQLYLLYNKEIFENCELYQTTLHNKQTFKYHKLKENILSHIQKHIRKMFKRIKLNYRKQLLRDGQNILSPQQKEEIIRTGKIILPI